MSRIYMSRDAKIILPAIRENLNRLTSFIVGFAKKNGIESQRIWELELATDEILTNIIDYAYSKKEGTIEVRCRIDEDRGFLMKIHDQGKPFNPLSFPEPHIYNDIQKVQTKGFGIYLIRQLMDSIVYKREGDKNCLTLEKRSCTFR